MLNRHTEHSTRVQTKTGPSTTCPTLILTAPPHYIDSGVLDVLPFLKNTVFYWSPDPSFVRKLPVSSGENAYEWILQIGPPTVSLFSAWEMFCAYVQERKLPDHLTQRSNGLFPGIIVNQSSGVCAPTIRVQRNSGLNTEAEVHAWKLDMDKVFGWKDTQSSFPRPYISAFRVIGDRYNSVREAVLGRTKAIEKMRILPSINEFRKPGTFVLPVEGIVVNADRNTFSAVINVVRGPFLSAIKAKNEFVRMCAVLNVEEYKKLVRRQWFNPIDTDRQTAPCAGNLPAVVKQILETAENSDSETSTTDQQ